MRDERFELDAAKSRYCKPRLEQSISDRNNYAETRADFAVLEVY